MMTLFRNIVIAPVSEVSCPLLEMHPDTQSLDGRVLPPTYCVSQTLCEGTKWKGKHRRNKLSKDYIGLPSNFKHLCHIGWNPQTGFATNLDPELKMILAQAGVTQDHLRDKQTSKKIMKTIEKQGGREAVLKEAKAKGLVTKFLDYALPYSVTPSPSELGSTCSSINELDCQALRTEHGFKDVLGKPSSISTSQQSLHNDLPSIVVSPASFMSPSKRTSQSNLILNLKEVQLKRAKSSNQLIPLSQDVLMFQIRKGTYLKPATQSPTSPQSPSDGGIVAALKDVIQKRHKAIQVSDEESDPENGDEWDE
ncbi:actin nucleation-promoting factor WASL-like [Hemicordylus capensis]|uniref:actin nucleation-promoting factor WASL-like n=1 Tax=Hemicordylus capensis TaxID=884348 RepID=UPI0023035407|nr:actin nucleation-promoting factor WASL-like [Hemicordylus capensis]